MKEFLLITHILVIGMFIGFYLGFDIGMDKQKDYQNRADCEFEYAKDPMIGVTAECYKYFAK